MTCGGRWATAAGAGTMCCPISAGPKRITAAKMTPTAARASCASNDSASAGRFLDAVAEAAEELGIPRTDDFNRGDNEGAGYFEVNQKGGLRWNARRAFLDPVAPPPQPARRHRRRGPAPVDGGAPRDRRDLPPGRHGLPCAGGGRGGAVGRRDRHARGSRAVGHRSRRAVADPRHRRGAGHARLWAKTSPITCRSARSSASPAHAR